MLFEYLNHQWKEISLERTLKKYSTGKAYDLFVLSCVMSGICTFKMGCNQFWMGILISINKYEISRTFYNVGAYIFIFQKVQVKIKQQKKYFKKDFNTSCSIHNIQQITEQYLLDLHVSYILQNGLKYLLRWHLVFW